MKKTVTTVAVALIVAMLGGCSLFGSSEPLKTTLANGTTTGNIVNLGFAVKQDDDLYFYFTGGDTYEVGDIIKSNPDKGDNSLVMHDGGLYMSVYDGSLYFCKPDGVYRAPMDTDTPELVLECKAEQLQISAGQMFYIEDGTIRSAMTGGEAVEFTSIDGAACLNVYEDKLYYIDSASGQVWQADTDGGNAKRLFDIDAKQFLILEGVFYYIDNGDSHIKRMSADVKDIKTVVPYACSSFNINLYGMFYTREVDGQWVCCYADTEGENEQVIEDSTQSTHHVVCMFDGGAVILGEEDFVSE